MDNQNNRETTLPVSGRHFRREDQTVEPETERMAASYAASSPRNAKQNRSYGSRAKLNGAAGRADSEAKHANTGRTLAAQNGAQQRQAGIAEVLEEVEAEQLRLHPDRPRAAYSSVSDDSSARDYSPRRRAALLKAEADRQRSLNLQMDTEFADDDEPETMPMPKKRKKKKKRKHYTVSDVLKIFVPWRGDNAAEAVRKIVFSTALCVVGVCTFLISSYYIDGYLARQEYEEMQARLEDALNNRTFNEPTYVEDVKTGEMIEWLDYNEIADMYLHQNPDMVGYVRIKDTMVSYPVVQKKSNDINDNQNEYYLYRTFHQESSRSGCIFLDYRCHFDEVVDHRRVVKNSDNVVIYGHNMNNMTMFGSLRNYYCNPTHYMKHPIVELYSLYNYYRYKIFAIFVVDGEDFDSEYAFDVWNQQDFANEDEFYTFVNNAKKRTVISTNVDVKYGDPLLSLYTCHGLHANAKLILLCRRVRDGEDPLAGTENATLNKNVLYTAQYYKMGHKVTFDPDQFVPYGPES